MNHFQPFFALLLSLLLIAASSLQAQIVPNNNGIVYVNKMVNGGNQSGNSWANAVPELADALKAANTNASIQQLWVAKGIYFPKYSAGTDNMTLSLYFGSPYGGPFSSFLLVNNLKLYGGFLNANETSITQRDTVNNQTILSGNNFYYHVVMSVGNVGTAEINGFTIKGGSSFPAQPLFVNTIATSSAKGAGIYLESSAPKINNCIIRENLANEGGGIYANKSTLTINNTLIRANVVTGINFTANATPWARGGGLTAYNCGMVSLNNCTIDSNKSVSSMSIAGGAGIWVHNNISPMQVNMNNSLIAHNKASSTLIDNTGAATAEGGGITVNVEQNSGTLTITNSTIDDNHAIAENGSSSGLFAMAAGGGLYTNCILQIDNCTISNNIAAADNIHNHIQNSCLGGALWHIGPSAIISNSIIEGNSAIGNCNPGGGGFANQNTRTTPASMNINKCIFRKNTAETYGGALYNFNGYVTNIKNTLIHNNTAAQGGGIMNASHTMYPPTKTSLTNCTLFGNKASNAGSIDGILNLSPSTTILQNSILYGWQTNNLTDEGTHATYSLVQGQSLFAGVGNINTDPMFMDTVNADFSLQLYSPAANSGNNALYSAIGNITADTDLDDNPRLFDGTIDMGAFELQQKPTDTSGTSIKFLTNEARSITIYPNPVQPGHAITMMANFNAPDVYGAEMTITDVQGKILTTQVIYSQEQRIFMPKVEGIYLISLKLRNGASAKRTVLVD